MKNSHAGISLAIVAGDISAALGYQLLINSRFSEKLKRKALNIFHETVVNTCHGEMLELFIKEKKDKLIEKDILNVYKYKTAYYTFGNPLKIGAILAGADSRFLKQIERFVLPIGIAFQIQDDILGLFASQEKLGKPIASDIEENQPNLLIFKTLSLADKKNRREFEKYLGKKKLKQKEIQEIRKIVKESGSFDYCQNLARSLVGKAKLKLQRIKAPQKEREFLLAMADYMIDRTY
jgi:geranylgeranyl pyrophosphate synthase